MGTVAPTRKRLRGWKEICACLDNVSPKTARRWARKKEGRLPVDLVGEDVIEAWEDEVRGWKRAQTRPYNEGFTPKKAA